MSKKTILARGGAVAGSLAALIFSTGAGEPQAKADFGFVITDLGVLFHKGEDSRDCPEGRSPSVLDAFLAAQSPAERSRLVRPENAQELERRYKTDYVFGPAGKDICTDAEAFDTPDRILQKPTQSKIGPGLDLDAGQAGASARVATCPHQEFVSPTGEPGVDNQFYRAVACNTAWRGRGEGFGDAVGELHWTEFPAVILVRGVESWRNDPEVEVVIAASTSRAPVDATRNIVDGGSLTMTADPRYRSVVKGRIADGVLTTDPTNLVLPRHWVGASGGEFILNHARIRARLTAEGALKGEAGGYRPIDNAIAFMRVGGPGVAETAGLECASIRKTMRMLADGDRNPKTGQCTSLSIGLSLAAKAAFVFDRGVLVGAPRGAM